VFTGRREIVKSVQIEIAEPIPVDKHFSIQFYAELWGLSCDTIRRWFQDLPGVLKVADQTKGRRHRNELRIPFWLAMKVYQERSK
jgi:hypothetical protein